VDRRKHSQSERPPLPIEVASAVVKRVWDVVVGLRTSTPQRTLASSKYSQQKGREERGRGVLRGWRVDFGGGARRQGLVEGRLQWQRAKVAATARVSMHVRKELEPWGAPASNRRCIT
jgi:hypothetical protein